MFMYRRVKITQKQKALIDKAYAELDTKNKQIEEHHKEVMDSIRYAKRIQTTLITSEKSIENSLKRLTKNS